MIELMEGLKPKEDVIIREVKLPAVEAVCRDCGEVLSGALRVEFSSNSNLIGLRHDELYYLARRHHVPNRFKQPEHNSFDLSYKYDGGLIKCKMGVGSQALTGGMIINDEFDLVHLSALPDESKNTLEQMERFETIEKAENTLPFLFQEFAEAVSEGKKHEAEEILVLAKQTADLQGVQWKDLSNGWRVFEAELAKL